jgi:hypothetical protein
VRCSAVSIALGLAATLFYASLCTAVSIEVYPGPGVDTYKSNLCTVEIFYGSNVIPTEIPGARAFGPGPSLFRPTNV